jgi:orotate phosphoribosyltransferase
MPARAELDGYASAVEAAHACLVAELRQQALVIGEVTLSSGATAAYYVDAKRAILRPSCFAALGELLRDCARRFEATAVGGVPISAIPVACAALAAAGDSDGDQDGVRKVFIVRKEAKQHGLGRWLDGPQLDPGERCMLVEDVVTTGSSSVDVLRRLRSEGVHVVAVVSVLDRLAGGAAAIEAVAAVPYVALTTIDDVYPDRPDRGPAGSPG